MTPDDRDPRDPQERSTRIPVTDKRVLGQQDAPPRESDLQGEVLADEGAKDPSGLDEQTAVTSQQMRSELDEATTLASERLDQLMRLKADFENYRKRVIREQTDVVDRASLRIVERLLPVLDDFERALEAARKHEEAAPIVQGLEIVYRALNDVLVAEGLEQVQPTGETFDPHQHEAVSSVPGDVPEPTVLEVVRPGYRVKGKTIRPALVHVSTPDEGAPLTEDEE